MPIYEGIEKKKMSDVSVFMYHDNEKQVYQIKLRKLYPKEYVEKFFLTADVEVYLNNLISDFPWPASTNPDCLKFSVSVNLLTDGEEGTVEFIRFYIKAPLSCFWFYEPLKENGRSF